MNALLVKEDYVIVIEGKEKQLKYVNDKIVEQKN